jgi:ParB family transcriptional regulator, chromosome partitioning protein
MDLEFHQLDLRYASLRTSSPAREGRLLASLDRHGQQLPVVVVAGGEEGRSILVDGYKRVRCLSKLARDTVRATCWDLSEAEALMLERLMANREGDSALEQGWLLRELRERFALTVEELARRFDRSLSWVSGRLGLVGELPEAIQDEVRRGRLVPHGAMKFLLPLCRLDRQGAVALARAMAPLRPSTRQTKALCVAFSRGTDEGRRYLLEHPAEFLRARESGSASLPPSPGERLVSDIGELGGIARRARREVRGGAIRDLTPPEQGNLRRLVQRAQDESQRLFTHITEELDDARRTDQNSDP